MIERGPLTTGELLDQLDDAARDAASRARFGHDHQRDQRMADLLRLAALHIRSVDSFMRALKHAARRSER